MQNTVILPLGTVPPGIDDLYAIMGFPIFIIAEGNMVSFYTANGTTTGNTIAVAVCPTRTDYPLLDTASKAVGTYEKPQKNFFIKKGVAITGGDAPDATAMSFPTALYNPKDKKFYVYYVGTDAGGGYNICLASGYSYDSLVKHTVSGVVTKIIANPGAGWTVSGVESIYAYFDKEENLIKLYYHCVNAGTYRVCVATSRNGSDF